MSKYINADWLNALLYEQYDEGNSADVDRGIGIAQDILNEMPSADVVEVKHGEWKEIASHKSINLENANKQYKELGYPHRNILHLRCSNCNMVTLVDWSIAYDFCPHCGADMRGETK